MIIIAGDSWGCGEWNDGHLVHTGLTEYILNQGHSCINLSRANSANYDTLGQLWNFVKNNPTLVPTIDKVFVFQTEWDRDFRVNELPDHLLENLKHGYPTSAEYTLTGFYHGLSKIGVPIRIIGGCSDTMWSDDFEFEYPGVKVVCQSLTNLLVTGDHRVDNPVYSFWVQKSENTLQLVKKYTTDGLDLLLNDIDLGSQRLETFKQNKNWFWPDNRHANRHAHKQLFDFLVGAGEINEG